MGALTLRNPFLLLLDMGIPKSGDHTTLDCRQHGAMLNQHCHWLQLNVTHRSATDQYYPEQNPFLFECPSTLEAGTTFDSAHIVIFRADLITIAMGESSKAANA